MKTFYNHPLINKSELARQIGMKPKTFRAKAKNIQGNKFSDKDIRAIFKVKDQFLKDIAIILAIIFLSSCRVTYTSKPHSTENIYKSANVTVIQFRNLSFTEGLDILVDSARCKQHDTVVIKSRIKSFLCFGSEKVYILR